MSVEQQAVNIGDRIRVIQKTDLYSEDYQTGDEFLVEGTWYGGVQVNTPLGIPVSLGREEYEVIESGRKEDGSPVRCADMMAEELVWREDSGLVTKDLGQAAGAERIYVRTDTIPPGAYSAKYHSHSAQEEFFYILEGAGTLRWNDGEYEVKKGDYAAKPAGRGTAHTFFNSGKVPLVILDVGTVQRDDICYYPDEDVFLQKSGEDRRVFKGAQELKGWSSDPNSSGIK